MLWSQIFMFPPKAQIIFHEQELNQGPFSVHYHLEANKLYGFFVFLFLREYFVFMLKISFFFYLYCNDGYPYLF